MTDLVSVFLGDLEIGRTIFSVFSGADSCCSSGMAGFSFFFRSRSAGAARSDVGAHRKTQHSTQQVCSRASRDGADGATGRRRWPFRAAEMRLRETGRAPMPRSVPPSQGGDTGSNPVGTAQVNTSSPQRAFLLASGP